MVRRHLCIAKAYCTGYLAGKVSRLPIDMQKPQKFSPIKTCNIRYICTFLYHGISASVINYFFKILIVNPFTATLFFRAWHGLENSIL